MVIDRRKRTSDPLNPAFDFSLPLCHTTPGADKPKTLFNSHPDETFAVDWALTIYLLFNSHFISCAIITKVTQFPGIYQHQLIR